MKSTIALIGTLLMLTACGSPAPSEGKEECRGNICVSHKLVACRAKVAIWEFDVYRKDNDSLQAEQAWDYVRVVGENGTPPEETTKHGFGPGKLPESFTLEQGKRTVSFGNPPDMISYELSWDTTCGHKNPLTTTK